MDQYYRSQSLETNNLSLEGVYDVAKFVLTKADKPKIESCTVV